MFERIKDKRNEGGFTLIELLIVIVILAILAAIVVFAVGSTTQNASASSCKAQVNSAQTAVEAFKAQQGSYPTSLAELTTTQADQQNPSITDGPWLRTVPSGPAGYSYSLNTTSGTVSASVPAGQSC